MASIHRRNRSLLLFRKEFPLQFWDPSQSSTEMPSQYQYQWPIVRLVHQAIKAMGHRLSVRTLDPNGHRLVLPTEPRVSGRSQVGAIPGSPPDLRTLLSGMAKTLKRHLSTGSVNSIIGFEQTIGHLSYKVKQL